MKYTCKSLTDVGRVRSANEDNMGDEQTPNGHLFVVCDGMGGHVGGATASSIAVKSIIEYFHREKYDNLILAIDRALSFANEQIYAFALNTPELRGMGTTAVVLLLRGEECYIGHVGDSRIYLRSDGKLNRITKDHSFVQTLVDSGVLKDEDAESDPRKNQILKALGIASEVKGTVCQAPILPKSGDMFLLCSDGLNGMVTDQDLEKIVREDDLDAATINLITAANNAGGHDNITASLVLIQESAHSSSQFQHFNPVKSGPDIRSTDTFKESNEPVLKNNNKFWYSIIGVGALVLGAIIFYMLKAGTDTPVDSVRPVITKEDLQINPCNNLDDRIGDSVVHCEANDTIKLTQPCDDMDIFFVIQKGVITSNFSKKIDEEDTVNPDNETKKTDSEKKKTTETGATALKLSDLKGEKLQKLQKGNEVTLSNGTHYVYGYVIKVSNKKVTSSKLPQSGPRFHTVQSGEVMANLIKYCNQVGFNITSGDEFYQLNKEKSSFKGKEILLKKLEADVLEEGWKLEIPSN